ncbi:unnamed protein product [Urochloa humidicola]
MKNPRSDPAPGASLSQGSGGEAFARVQGRDVAGGVEKTSAWTGEKKTKFQSTLGDLGMIAGEEGQGQIEGFDWDDDMLKEEIDSYSKRQYRGLPDFEDDDIWTPIDDQQNKDMKLRHAIYRIKAHKMLKGVELSIEELRKMYPPAILEENGYFQWFEHGLEWYFDPGYCLCPHLEDYQRLALPDTGEYLHWDYYHDTCSTLKSDQQFVYFWETLSSKTKWIKKFWGAELSERKRIENVVYYHAVKIAKDCTDIFSTLLHSGFAEYLWSVRFDNTWYEDFACLYFEIWKLVAKEKMSFKDVLDQVKEKGMQTFCRLELEAEFDRDHGPITRHYNTYVAEIDENLPEGEAYKLVMEAVKKFVPKLKSYYDYAKKKLDIAEKIGLIPPSPHESSTWQDSSETTA